jgi:hypothetical protein
VKLLKDNRIAILIVLTVLVLGKLVLIKHLLSSIAIGPLVFGDELIYRIDAEKIFRGELFSTTHYPPLYPLLLSVAFFSKAHWYEWMLYINVFLSSLILIPVWLISLRFLPKAASIAVVLIAALSSFHVYYPRVIMSENLHMPLFSLSIFLLLNTDRETKTKSIIINTLFGISMALGYLTKYLYLVAIPVLILLWWAKPFFNDDPGKRKIIEASRLVDFLAICSGFILTYVPWLIYVHSSGIPVTQGLGAEFIRSGIRDYATWKSLVLWITLYMSYGILALAPYLLVFSLYIFMLLSGSIKNVRHESFFLMIVVLLSAVFLATAIQHSWRAGYNYPVPKKVMGRYVMHLIPFWLIVFMISLNKIKNAVHRLKLSQIIFCSLLCFASLFLALAMLMPLQDARGSNFSFVNYPDGAMFMRKPFVFLFFTLFAVMSVIFVAGRRKRILSDRFIPIFSLLLLLIQAGSAYSAMQALYSRSGFELHGRALSQFIKDELKTIDGKITMISDGPGLQSRRLAPSVGFWMSDGEIKPPITFISLKDYFSNDRGWTEKLYIITRGYSGTPLYSYSVKKQNYYIYDFEPWFQGRRLPDKNSD